MAAMPIGTIIAFAGAKDQSGWFVCNGRDISKEGANSKDLRALLGTKFNKAGDPADCVRVPDLQGKVVVGLVSTPADPDFATYQLNSQGGRAKFALSQGQMPQHTHKVGQAIIPHQQSAPTPPDPTPNNPGSLDYLPVGSGAWGVHICSAYDSSKAGGTDEIDVRQPYVVLNYLISY
jgi:microcystin-dependent protein